MRVRLTVTPGTVGSNEFRALVTDYDTGVEGVASVEGVAAVHIDDVFAMLAANVDRTRALLTRAIPAVPTERACACGSQN